MMSFLEIKPRGVLNWVAGLAILFTASTAIQAAIIPAPANSVVLDTGQSVKLDQLTLNNISGIVVGDKLFSNFVYSHENDMPAPESVNVVAISDGTRIGIRFQGSFRDLPGGEPSDAGVSFSVTPLDTQRKVVGVDLQASIFLDPDTPGSFGSVDEDFTGNDPENPEILSVFNSTFGAGGSDFEDSVIFADQYSTLNVKKNIHADAAPTAIQPVRLTIIDQLFDQVVVPEPASLGLVFGCLAMLGIQRRRT